MRKLRTWVGAIILGPISISVWAANPTNLPTVVVREAKQVEVSQNLSFPATVEARVHATVLAEADGVVRKIHASLGQQVKRGRRLFTIQQNDPIYQFAPVSTITPVSGMVSELSVTEGALVSKGQKLASVTDPTNLKVLIEIPAQDLALLQTGAVGKLECPALPHALNLTLVGVSPTVDSATGTATAELTPSKEDVKLLRPGLVGKVSFKAGVHKGFLVPEDAILQSQNQYFLRVVKDGVAKKVPVQVGQRMRGFAEIVKGLEEGWHVVERASGFIADGEQVKVEQAKVEQPAESSVN